MAEDPAKTFKDRLRADLKAALKQGLKPEVSLLRALLAAIDNAEAPAQSVEQSKESLRLFGDGTTEVPRLTLSREQLHALVTGEIEARQQTARELEQLGRADRTEVLRNEAVLLGRYVD